MADHIETLRQMLESTVWCGSPEDRDALQAAIRAIESLRGGGVSDIRASIEYSRNFATAKPDIGATEKEHILGLCNLLERRVAPTGRVPSSCKHGCDDGCCPQCYADTTPELPEGDIRGNLLRLAEELDNKGRYNDADLLRAVAAAPQPQACITCGKPKQHAIPIHACACASLTNTPPASGGVDAYPTGNDREVLRYLMQQFDAESWECPRCGHSESCADMDSAIYLREYLASTPSPTSARELPELDWMAQTMAENYPLVAIAHAINKILPGLTSALPSVAAVPSEGEASELADWVEARHATIDKVRRERIAYLLRQLDRRQKQQPDRPLQEGTLRQIDQAHDNYMRGNIDATTRDWLIEKAKKEPARD